MKQPLLFLCVVLSGCGAEPEAPEQPAPAAEVVTRDFVVPLFEAAEADLRLEADDRIVVRFQADRAIDWDIHTHSKLGITTLLEGKSAHDEITFVAPEPGGFSILWQNKHESKIVLHVEIELPDGAAIESWYPNDDPPADDQTTP